MSEELSAKQTLDNCAKFISGPWLKTLEKYGLNIVETRREGAKIFDSAGKAYYDCFCSGGQYVIGHRRPEMIEAFRAALHNCDLGNFFMISEQKAALAKLLAEITPGNLKTTVYGVSRGESNEFALKLARGFTGRKEIVCFDGAFHGGTGFALSASSGGDNEKLFGPLIPGVKRVPLDDASLRKAVNDDTAAVIVEPVQSDAGIVFPPEGFLQDARKTCDRKGAALVFDEGQLAFGRTGKMFACERAGVTPDILTVAKGMGATLYPISATIFTSRLNRFMLTHPLIHLSTFGGADLGCTIAMAAINFIRDKKLVENSEKQGKRLLDGLKKISGENSSKFRDARGIGLLTGIEAADAATAVSFTRNLAANRVIALPTPGAPAVVRFTPPIDIEASDIDAILDAAGEAAKKV
jgi:putrescine aminotransferase